MNESIIFWGALGHAKVLKDSIRHKNIKLVALFDNNSDVKSPFYNVPIYYKNEGFEKWYSTINNNKIYFAIAIGGDKGKVRMDIHNYLENKGLLPYTIIHDSSFIAENVIIGDGSQILAKSAICVDTSIGKECIINTGATVDHECILGDGVHICPGANVAGCVEIKSYSMIGTGAIILPRIKIGKKCIIGAGAVVTKDIPDDTIVVGNPARKLERR